MSFDTSDTICAIATTPGGANRGMVRISGTHAVAIAAELFEAADRMPLQKISQAIALPGRVTIELDRARRSLPCDLFIWPTNRSYTREPVVELHTIGSPPLVRSLLAATCRAGARLAEPGEFTLRAFLAGRIDLTQAEAVLGVIDANGADALDAALAQLAGGLARPLHHLREELLQLLAELEAGLDFVEEDIEFVSRDELHERLESASCLLEKIAQQMDSRQVAADHAQIALVGPPNAGKSSLFNALVKRFSGDVGSDAERMAALVSPRAGTTRDYLTAAISLNGVECDLVDTAGVDDEPRVAPRAKIPRDPGLPASEIESAARSFALERRKRAAIRVFCAEPPRELTNWAGAEGCDIVVLTKSDIMPPRDSCVEASGALPIVVTSSCTGQGLDALCTAIHRLLLGDAAAQRGAVVSATADRCHESVRLAQKSLVRGAEIVRMGRGNELAAVELRTALAELGTVVGAVYTDDLLDRIFRTFCIGK